MIANAEMVSSGSMTVARTLDQKELEALPTSARNFTQLLVIEPGVSADISELLSNDNASISPSVNGARTTNNSFVFNGVDVTNLLCCNSRVNGSSGTIETAAARSPATSRRRSRRCRKSSCRPASTTPAPAATAAATSRSSARAARTASAAASTTTTRTTS